uniref:Retinol dehydrogenase 1 n=1 Tax=Cyprinus carpio carpio TaxID=630221 RepID=A0A9J7ZXI6_CYPCA
FRDSRQILVTGCDSGFGQLDRRGLHVIAACLTEPGASRLRAAASPRLETLLLNVTDSASVESALERVLFKGPLFLWEHPFAPMEWMQLEDEVTLKFLLLLKKARGRVVNVDSILGRVSLIGGGYCLTKYGVEAFSDSLNMMHFGAKVSITEPGFFNTQVTDLSLIEDDLKKWWHNFPAEVRRLQEFSMKTLAISDLSKVTSCMHAIHKGELNISTNNY